MPRNFYSTEQYFPGWAGGPILFVDRATWVPYSMAIHRDGETILHENIWVEAGKTLQLEFPWGVKYTAIQAGERIYARITG